MFCGDVYMNNHYHLQTSTRRGKSANTDSWQQSSINQYDNLHMHYMMPGKQAAYTGLVESLLTLMSTVRVSSLGVLTTGLCIPEPPHTIL